MMHAASVKEPIQMSCLGGKMSNPMTMNWASTLAGGAGGG